MISEQKKNKKLFFLMGMPRSGNTLFASIMNQNPEIACTPNSLTLEIIKDLSKHVKLIYTISTYIEYENHNLT